ncbi:PAS domain S-box protein [Halomicronema sp. CCY15110]|uniref:sensor histidine kinase n=1 Tax=Halomicronema sp. CCY15110 TaxID=2767773 RepID=UPI001950ED97|nr:PAS domain S-box protein [Halomicronema sp. CCY15110]
MFFQVVTNEMASERAALLLPDLYIPHGHCYLWQSPLVGLHGFSDGIIAIAYFTIAAALIYFVRQRQDVPLRGVFWLFGAFIAACGLTHLIAIWTLWFPYYWLSGTVKAVTAVISLFTALSLIPRIPQALAIPSTESLAQLNQTLSQEVSERQQTEAKYQALAAELESRVTSRTAQLTQAQQDNEQLLGQEQTTRAELEAALQQQQDTTERLNIALSAARMGTWDWHLDQECLQWSPKTYQILGFDADQEQPTYDRWQAQVHPEDVARIEAAMAIARANQEIFAEEYRVQWSDQSWHWVLAQGRFLYADDQPQRMIGVVQETTEAKRSALALAASEARFRVVFEQAAVGMARLSPDGNWLQVNETFCSLLGYEADELVQQNFQAITDPADVEQDQRYLQQLRSGQGDICRFEKRYLHKDGTSIWTMVTVSTETDEQHQVRSFIAVIEDIRKLKQTTAELEQRAKELEQMNGLLAMTNALVENRNAELDQFAYVASHDLKAPLRAIANLSEWIEEDLGHDLPEENRHQLDLLRNRVHRMEALINGLLEYSRVGRRERQIIPVDVRQMLVETIDLIVPPPAFTIALPAQMPALTTSQSALNQVFSNLITNAIKHHDREDGRIDITAIEHDDFIEFAVSDDGPGIAPQYQSKVFTIFQTLKSRDVLESTGIGLAIVKKTVESEGGTITLESVPGEGCTFRFKWPKQS